MTSGNPIFDKNLECIGEYNPDLKQKLLDIDCLYNIFELVETDLGEPNLKINGINIHLQSGAEEEAREAFENVKNTPRSRHIIFGLGLGYLFKEACEKSKGTVILYEPDLEVLRVTLERVDFSEELSKKNVLVTSDMEFLVALFNHNYVYRANSALVALFAHRTILYRREIEEIKHAIQTMMTSCEANYNLLISAGLLVIKNVLTNIPYLLNATPLYELKDVYKGKTAIIASAGPSLDLNIETIKKNRDKFVLFGVGTSFKALAKHGITPDFLTVVESSDCSGQLGDFDLSQINLITETSTHRAICQSKVKQHFLFPSKAGSANNYWAELSEVDISPYLARGTVAYAAMASAQMLGFSKIILAGQDLAFVNNKCYSNGGAYSELVVEIDPETNKPKIKVEDKEKYMESFQSSDEQTSKEWLEKFAEQKIKGTEACLYTIKGINGEMLPTLAVYAVFVDYFVEFAEANKELTLINSSMLGAQIDGFENIPLDVALENDPVIKKIDYFEPFKYDRKKFFENLKKSKDKLKDILKEFKKAKDIILKYDREFKKSKKITPKLIKYVSQLLDLYNTISDEYENSHLYKSISFQEHNEVLFMIEENEEFDVDNVKSLYISLKIYFKGLEIKMNEVIDLIEENEKLVGKDLCLKS